MIRAKTGICAVAIIFTMVVSSLVCAGETGGKKEGIVASVNSVDITEKECDNTVKAIIGYFMRMRQVPGEEQIKEIRSNVIDMMVKQELMYQECAKNGILASEQEIDERYKKEKEKSPTEEEFQKALNMQGITESEYKDRLKKVISVNKMITEQFVNKTEVTDDEMKEFYSGNKSSFHHAEKVRARHILVAAKKSEGEQKRAEAKKKIHMIKEKVDKGENFEALAREYSDCGSKERGGDLDYFERGRMVKSFEDVAFSMKKGEVSGIVETPFGYHIIKVEDKKPERTESFDDVKEVIKRNIMKQRINEKVEVFAEELEKKASIVRYGDKG